MTGQLAVTTYAGLVRGTLAQFFGTAVAVSVYCTVRTIVDRRPASAVRGVGLEDQITTRYGSFAYAKPVLRYYDHVNVLLRYPYSLLLHPSWFLF